MNFISSLDQTLFKLLNQQGTAFWLDGLMKAVTEAGHAQWFFAVLWVAWMVRGGKQNRIAGIILILVVLIVDFGCSSILKPFFARPRPWTFIPDTRILADLSRVSAASFPSNHAANSAAVAVYLSLLVNKNWMRLALIGMAFLVGYSRIYIGVHTPTDILGGFLVGGLCGLAGAWAFRKISSRTCFQKGPPSSSV